MKICRTLAVSCLAGLLVVAASSFAVAKEDPYDTLARELSNSATLMTEPKIAIIPFSYIDKRKSDAGMIISERLTTRMVKLKKCKIIERQLLENVLQELHLETTGVIDAESTKRLGKVLGVEAIITGTLMDTGAETAEVNARVIKAETAEVLATASANLVRDWTDAPAVNTVYVPASQPAEAAPQEQPVGMKAEPQYVRTAAPAPRRPAVKVDGFFDILAGNGSGTMNLKYSNPTYRIKETEIGIDMNGNGVLESAVGQNEIKFEGAKTQSASPFIGLRVGGFGKYFGGDFEFSYFSQHIIKQTNANFSFSKDDYLQVDVLTLLSGDLLLRYPGKIVQPYTGLGFGMTLNHITSPYVSAYSDGIFQKPFDSYEIGFLMRIPFGLRVNIGDAGSLFVEYRAMMNAFSFTRDIKSEQDSVSMDLGMLLFGLGFSFR
jgi:TolB-like protein